MATLKKVEEKPAVVEKPAVDPTEALTSALNNLADSNKKPKIKFATSKNAGVESRFSIMVGKSGRAGQVFVKDNLSERITEIQQKSIEQRAETSEDDLENA